MPNPLPLPPSSCSDSHRVCDGIPDSDAAAQHRFIYLASQSPRRQELLAQIGVRFELLLAEAHEDAEALEAVLAGESPDDYVVRVTRAKADAAAARFARLLSRAPACQHGGAAAVAAPILVADTTVALESEILGKPHDAADALRMLKRLAGREHQVLTAVALIDIDGTVSGALSLSTVRFAAASDAALARYAASGEPMGKAGAYGIQGGAAEFVAHIAGSYSGIMGLPLFETAALLRAARVAFP
jgi:septum formation protein